jgi:hypothetical protein
MGDKYATVGLNLRPAYIKGDGEALAIFKRNRPVP